MTELELHELDEWLAQHVGHHDEEAGLQVWFACDHRVDGLLCYSSSPRVFSLVVKREIKRRGWSWQAHSFRNWDRYWFGVYAAPDFDLAQYVRKIGESIAETEELAGCLAFKQAVEAESGKDIG